MDLWWIALLSGAASGLLVRAARRAPVLGWIALAPLGVALLLTGSRAGLAGAILGGLMHGGAMRTQPRALWTRGLVGGTVGWGVSAALAGLALRGAGPVWLVVVLPALALIAPLPMQLLGAPRWVYAPLACTQEPWPVVLRAGWYGGEHTVTTLLAGVSAALLLALPAPWTAPWVSLASLGVALTALGLAARSLASTRSALDAAPRVRIAAVVVDGEPPEVGVDPLWPLRSAEYGDVERTRARYAPHVAAAAEGGARLVVLPEVAVRVDAGGRARWIEIAREWAAAHQVTLVAGLWDEQDPANALVVAEPTGRVLVHHKQHPAPGLEPAPPAARGPGQLLLDEGLALSTVICVDLDYTDLVAPVRAAGGVLVAPSNDWRNGFEQIHDQTAAWAAVLTGATVLRATGHGLSSVRDGAGRVLARGSSEHGALVLTVDAPLAPCARARA